jgi:hypothetical protein
MGPWDRAVAKPVCWRSVHWDLTPARNARTCRVMSAQSNPNPNPKLNPDPDPNPNLNPNLNQAPISTPL